MASTETHKIEKGIPIPPGRRGRPEGGIQHLIRSMEPGDSVLFPAPMPRNNIAARARVATKRAADGRSYVVRKVDGGVRLWRVA